MRFSQILVKRHAFGSALLAGLSFATLMLQAETVSGQSIVQLPSFHRFSYSGSAWVPDRGGTHLGGALSGFDRSSLYRTPGLGLPSRATSSLRSVTDAQIGVYIIDHHEWDRQILGGTPEEFMRRYRAEQRAAANEPSTTARRHTASASAGKSVAAGRPNGLLDLPPTEEQIQKGKQLVRTGRIAAERGSREWTIHYYRLAQHYLDDRLGALAEKELQSKLSEMDKSTPKMARPR